MVLLDTQVPSLCDNSLSHALIICKLPAGCYISLEVYQNITILITVAFILMGFPI